MTTSKFEKLIQKWRAKKMANLSVLDEKWNVSIGVKLYTLNHSIAISEKLLNFHKIMEKIENRVEF